MCKVSRKQQKKLFRIGFKPTVCKIKLPPSQSFVRLDVLKSIQGPWMKRPYTNVKYCVYIYIYMYCVYMYISVCVCITYKYMLYVYIFLYIA